MQSLWHGLAFMKPQSKSKISLVWPLAHNSPPQNLPWGVHRHNWLRHSEMLWKDSGKSAQFLLKDAKERKLFHGLTFTQS